MIARKEKGLRRCESPIWRGFLKAGPSTVWKQHGPLVSISQTATQIYAEKCTTKAIASKLAIEFPNTAPKEKRRYSWRLALRERVKKTSRAHPWLNPLFKRNPPCTPSQRVCSIWTRPGASLNSRFSDLIMFLLWQTYSPLWAFPTHLG